MAGTSKFAVVIGTDLSIDLADHYFAASAIVEFTQKMATWILDWVDDKFGKAQAHEMVNSMGFD